jgi:adenosine/AMP kinase
MNLASVRMNIPADANLIVGQSHFIKTVEDLYEVIVTTAPQMKFGIAFNEASQDRLVRHDGNDDDLRRIAVENARAIAAGHVFVILLREGFPINILPRIKECHEVVRIFCATANPTEVVIAQSGQGRGVLGVIDGETPLGVETDEDIEKRKSFLRMIGYKR